MLEVRERYNNVLQQFKVSKFSFSTRMYFVLFNLFFADIAQLGSQKQSTHEGVLHGCTAICKASNK